MGCGGSVASPTKARAQQQPTYSSYDEWKAANAAERLKIAMSREDSRAELRVLFTSLDTDGDGSLSGAEWSQGIAANEQIVAKYFGSQVGEPGPTCAAPTVEEFLALFNQLCVAASRAANVLNTALKNGCWLSIHVVESRGAGRDMDGNGSLSWDEFAAGAERITPTWT